MSPTAAAASSLPAMRSEDASRLSLATVMLVGIDDLPLADVRACLEDVGHGELVVAQDAGQVEELLAIHEPDVLLLQAGTHQRAGLDALARLRELDPWRHLPVILLAARDDAEAKRQALDLGASEIVATPLDPSELVLRLRNALCVKSYQDRILRRDPLTGLANRGEFMRRIETVLAKSALEQGFRRSLLLLDIDRFKQINDSIGHEAGDALLVEIAQRLGEVVARHGGGNRRAGSSSPTPWLARLDSDRFMALLPGGPEEARLKDAMQEIAAAVAAPIHLNGREFHVSASVGVACFPADGNSVEILTQRAELACKQAKKRGGNAIHYFTGEMHTRAAERLTLENHLRYAIRRNELRLYYQPKVHCATLQMAGVEALIRWQHPVHGLIAPQRFIPLAEEAGLINEIGEWALREACGQGAQWARASLPPLHIAVNLSAAQLLHGDLPGKLSRILADTGFQASRLTLELTESMLMTAGDQAMRCIESLKALGVALSLDDFGTGYSPLTYLHRLPIDEIKIDRSFVHGLPTQQDSAAIASAVISLAAALGLQVVAEGVETAEEFDFLRKYRNCYFQGFLFSQPVPAEVLTAMLQTARDQADARAG